MRTLVALTLYVSLSFSTTAATPDWKTLREQGAADIDRGNFVAAESALRESLALAETPTQTALSSSDLGVALHDQGKDAAARTFLDRALKTWIELPDGRHLGPTAEALTVVLRNSGDYSATEALLRRVLPVDGISVDSRAELRNLLGDLLREEGRTAESRAVFDSVVAMPGIKWRTEAEARIGVADLAREVRQWEVSLENWRVVIDLARKHDDSRVEAVALRGLGTTWHQHGSPAQAEPLLRKALALFEAETPQNLHQTATTLGSLAELYMREEKPAMAEEALMRAIDLDERGLGESHPQVGALLQLAADVAARRRDFDQARRYMDRSMRIMTSRFGENSVVAGSAWAGRGRIEQAAGNPAVALSDYQKALALLSAGGPDLQGFQAAVMENCSEVLKLLHRKGEAKALQAQAKSLATGYRP